MGRRTAAVGLAAMAAVVAVTVLAGCTQSAGSAGSYQMQDGSTAAAPTAAGDQADSAGAGLGSAGGGAAHEPAGEAADNAAGDAAGGAAKGDAAQAAPSRNSHAAGGGDAPPADDRQIIRTATVALQVTVPAPQSDPEGSDTDPGPGHGTAPDTRQALADAAARAATKVRALAPGSGGYVSASDGGGDTISIVLRIPASSYDTVMNSLDGIGRVTSRTEKTDDVTDEMVDVASRIATMKASIDRIRALLAQADEIGDVISIESELASREADLESLQNRQTALKGQVALSTISVTVSAVTEATVLQQVEDQQRTGFLGGLQDGWRALTAFGTWLGSVAGALLPFTPLIAVAVWLLVWATRRRRAVGAGGVAQPAGSSSPPTGAGDLP